MGSIVIDGVAIPETMLREEMAHHRAASPAEARQQAGQALAIRALLLHRAETLGLSAEPETDPDGRLETEDEALLRVLLEQELQVTEPEDVEIERFYQANTDRFRAPLLYAASHILFPVAEGQSSDAALAEAISALAYLQSAPGEFANLARAHSGCPSAGVGGSLGQLSKGDLLAPVEQALLSVEPGAFYPDPVLSPFGVHVLRLDQLWPGEILPFEAVRSKIRLHLQSRAWMAAAARYTAALAQEARESGLNLMLDETGRVAPSGLTFGQWLNPDAEHERTLLNWLKAADSALFARACETAEKAGLAPIAFITQTLRTRLDAADDEAWTQIISVAQNASDPTLAALSHLLKQALTPVKRSITLIKRN